VIQHVTIDVFDCQEPILILHAEDDKVIPFELAEKLYNETKHSCNVKFHSFNASLELGHNNIYKYANLGSVIRSFIENDSE